MYFHTNTKAKRWVNSFVKINWILNSFCSIIQKTKNNRFETDHRIWWLIYKNWFHIHVVCSIHILQRVYQTNTVRKSEWVREKERDIGLEAVSELSISGKCKRFYSQTEITKCKAYAQFTWTLSHNQYAVKCASTQIPISLSLSLCVFVHTPHSLVHYVSWNNSIIFPKHFDQLLQSMKLNRDVYGL